MGKKTGPPPTFTAEQVVDAALAHGIASFTMSQLAKDIGVAPGALYRLFASRDDIVAACHERAVAWVADSGFASCTTWQELLRLWARTCWDVCEEFPELSLSVFTFSGSFAAVERLMQDLSARLSALGLEEDKAFFALDFIGDTIIATHLGLQHMDESDGEWANDAWKYRKTDFIIAGLEAGLG